MSTTRTDHQGNPTGRPHAWGVADRRARVRDAVVQAFPQDDGEPRPEDVERAWVEYRSSVAGKSAPVGARRAMKRERRRSFEAGYLAALSARPDQAQEVERLREEVQRLTAMKSVDTAFYRLTVTERDHARAKADCLTRERDAALARVTSWEAEADRLAQVAGDEHRRAEAAEAVIDKVREVAQYALDHPADLEGQSVDEARWGVAYAILHALDTKGDEG